MKYKVTLNGKTYEVEVNHGEAMILDEYEAYAPAPAAPAAPAAAAPAPAPAAAPAPAPAAVAGEQVLSPMPGTIVKVNVKIGQKVKSGEVLAVLEAMKMENEIMAPHDAIVAQILTDTGTKVDTGTPIIVLN
ncbi:MAG: biotin/lipoyl-binding protein [Lachnospiraceae bacterium]|nr:biotin/lipoyl-binding protein [Lachnospiraceae bacterium]